MFVPGKRPPLVWYDAVSQISRTYPRRWSVWCTAQTCARRAVWEKAGSASRQSHRAVCRDVWRNGHLVQGLMEDPWTRGWRHQRRYLKANTCLIGSKSNIKHFRDSYPSNATCAEAMITSSSEHPNGQQIAARSATSACRLGIPGHGVGVQEVCGSNPGWTTLFFSAVFQIEMRGVIIRWFLVLQLKFLGNLVSHQVYTSNQMSEVFWHKQTY